MKNIQTRFDFLNEKETLFGKTAESLADKLASWDRLKFTKQGRGSTLGHSPAAKEVQAKYEKGVYPYATYRADAKFEGEMNTPTNVIKAVAEYLFGKDKGWKATKIEAGEYAKSPGDRTRRAQGFKHPALGMILISCNEKTTRRYETTDSFYCEVTFLRDEPELAGKLDAETAETLDSLMAGKKTKEEKLAVIRYLKDKYTEFTDSI
jgi:hypothetical protein